MTRAFRKYQGLGNDFVLIDQRADGALISPERAKSLCDRHRGIGADGVLTLLPPRIAGAVARMHIYNADGSVAEMCGNGLRCAVHALITGQGGRGPVRVDTDAGPRDGWLEDDGRVRVTLGPAGTPRAVELPEAQGLAISLGNPHFVLRAHPAGTDLRALAERLGPELERRRPEFPEGTNVEFLAPAGPATLDLVVFERGCGITEACGTGAAAAAIAARHFGLVAAGERRLEVRLPGGPLVIELRARDGAPDEVLQTGAAVHVFDGTIDLR